jgi:hypothetical protein
MVVILRRILSLKKNIVVQVNWFSYLNFKLKTYFEILEVETETINQELEKQFNEGLQSKIAHIHHGGLGFHGDNPSASSSNDWQHQPIKAKFVPAKTEVGSSLDHVKVDNTEKVDEKSTDKQEKKKKPKS